MARGWAKRRGKTWTAIVPVKDADGTWHNEYYAATRHGFPNTKRGAEAFAAERAAETAHQPRRVERDITVTSWVAAVIGSRHRVKPTSRATYTTVLRAYITPHIGTVKVRDLTKTDVLGWQRTLATRGSQRGGPLKPNTVALAHRVLTTALHAAVEDGVLRRNPATLAGEPVIPKLPPKALTQDELARLLVVTDAEPDAALWRVFIHAALRVGEVVALRWADVDWANQRILVQRTLTRDEQSRAVMGDTAKTPASVAPVDVPPSLLAVLRTHRDRQAFTRGKAGRYWQDHGLVFAGPIGQAQTPAAIRRQLTHLCAVAGVPRATPHHLRHTSATVALALGQHPKIVQERLRHSKISVTMDTYSHLVGSMGADAARELDAALDALGSESVATNTKVDRESAST